MTTTRTQQTQNQLNAALKNTITTTELLSLLCVQYATVLKWRRQEVDPLPYIFAPGTTRNNVWYVFTDIVAWAKRNKKRVWFTNLPDLRESSVL